MQYADIYLFMHCISAFCCMRAIPPNNAPYNTFFPLLLTVMFMRPTSFYLVYACTIRKQGFLFFFASSLSSPEHCELGALVSVQHREREGRGERLGSSHGPYKTFTGPGLDICSPLTFFYLYFKRTLFS